MPQPGDGGFGKTVLIVGIVGVLGMFFGWFRSVIHESLAGNYNNQVDRSFRMGMMWFIFSEVMFFGAFFGALFYARMFSVPWLGRRRPWRAHQPVPACGVLRGGWGAAGGGGPEHVGGPFETVPAWGLPLLNTLILLSSSVTVTIAHHALKAGHRGKILLFLGITVLLGALFLYFQAHEYIEAYKEFNLTLHSGVYGSTFFMLTGFHGMHVTLGTIMLAVIWFRVLKGHFSKEHHFALRGGRLVLAFRRRGLAGPVHVRLHPLSETPFCEESAIAQSPAFRRAIRRCGDQRLDSCVGLGRHRLPMGAMPQSSGAGAGRRDRMQRSTADAVRMQPAHPDAEDHHGDQQQRQADAAGQRPHRALARRPCRSS